MFVCIVVKLNANRMVVGTLRGFDQFMNLVVDNTVEVNGNERNEIGMVVGVPSFHIFDLSLIFRFHFFFLFQVVS